MPPPRQNNNNNQQNTGKRKNFNQGPWKKVTEESSLRGMDTVKSSKTEKGSVAAKRLFSEPNRSNKKTVVRSTKVKMSATWALRDRGNAIRGNNKNRTRTKAEPRELPPLAGKHGHAQAGASGIFSKHRVLPNIGRSADDGNSSVSEDEDGSIERYVRRTGSMLSRSSRMSGFGFQSRGRLSLENVAILARFSTTLISNHRKRQARRRSTEAWGKLSQGAKQPELWSRLQSKKMRTMVRNNNTLEKWMSVTKGIKVRRMRVVTLSTCCGVFGNTWIEPPVTLKTFHSDFNRTDRR